MGTSAGRKGMYDFTKRAHRKHALRMFATKHLTGKRLFEGMCKYVNDDSLFDKPTKKNAARLVIWLAWIDQMKVSNMAWFKPCMHYAKFHDWDPKKDCYGDAAAYGRLISVVC